MAWSPKIDSANMLATIRARHAREAACPKHRFEGLQSVRFGEKFTCLNCGVQMRLTDIGQYIRGYQAAGGDKDDIWPGWK